MKAQSLPAVSHSLQFVIRIGDSIGKICCVILLLTTSRLFGQTTCGDVQVQLTPDYSYAIGSSSGGTSYSFTLGGKTLAQGAMTQLALFHYDTSLASTSGIAPSQSVGASLVSGKFGSAVEVASGGSLSYTQQGNLSTMDGTIEMWISPQYDGTNSAYSNGQALFEYWGGSATNSLTLATAGSGNNVYLFAGASGIYAGYTAVSGFTGWKAGEWHHLAMTYSTSQSRLRLYVDGVLVQENDGTIAIVPGAGGTFSIASGYGNATNFVVDEVRTSNNEMPAGAIAYDAGRTGPFANNEVYLPLAGVNPGQLAYAVANCGSASLTYTGVPITNFSPASGLLAPESTSVAVSFNTIQPTLCRYSLGAAEDYASMQELDTGSATTVHSGTISGLFSDPRLLNLVYLRCASNPDYLDSLVYRSVAAPTGSFPRIGSIWKGEYILTTKPDQAAKIQLYLAPGGMSPSQALALRAQNPNVLIMPSVNAQETGGYPVVPSSYLLHDINGNPISDWPGNYLLNLTKPEVATFLAQYAVQQYLSTANLVYDGIFWDNFNTSIQDPYYDYQGVPHQIDANGDGIADDPTTLNAAWSAGIYSLISTFDQLAPNAYAAAHNAQPVPMNFADFNGVSFTMDAPLVREGAESFGTMLDDYDTWFANGRQPVISAIQSAPPSQIAYGYGYNPINNVTPSVLQFSQTYYPYMRFGLATSLMNDGFSIFDFGDNQSPVNWWYDEYDFNLGQPIGPAVQLASGTESNLLINGGFENGLTNWLFIVNSQDTQARATVALDTTTFAQGTTSAHIDVISAGTADWHVDLEQPNVSLAAGKTYQLTFSARADQSRSITVNSQGGAPNYPNYGLNDHIPIGTTWKMYSASFVAPVTATDGRIQFFVGDVAGNVWIDGVQLTQVSGVYRRDFSNGIVLLNGTPSPYTVSLEAGLNRFTGSQAPLYQYIVDDAGADFTADSTWTTVTYDSGSFHDAHYQPPYYHAWNSTAHLQSTPGSAAQWKLKIPADGQYTIQIWLPAAPGASGWTKSAVYELVSGTTVLASATIDQTTASAGDAWHSIATLNLTAAGAPFLRVHNGGSGPLIADAVYVTSTARYNDGSAASQVTLAPFDGILLKRQISIPVLEPITIQTNPAGLLFSVDGTEYTAPATLNLAAGTHTIAVLPQQTNGSGTQYVFNTWSDGGSASHTITVGYSPATYVANFRTQYQLDTSAFLPQGGTVSPASGLFYNPGTEVDLSATPDSGYVFTGWTGNVASPSSVSTTITMNAPEAVTATFRTPSGLQFIPVTPCRVADTRNATGAFGGPEMSAKSTREFDIPQSACSIPATAIAYSLNVTVVPSGPLGYLSMWPSGEAQPLVSTLNSYDGRVKANAAIVPAGTNGGIDIYVTDATHVILDIDGYFVPAGTASALSFYPVAPCRVVDTRNPTGTQGGPSIGNKASRNFPVQSSSCGIPATATAYSLNVTAVPHGPLGYLTIWPTGATQPLVSTLNSYSGGVVANAAIVPAGTRGQVSVYVSDASDVVMDINGYFAPPGTEGLSLYTVAPCRPVDTRTGAGAFKGVLLDDIEGSTCAPPATAQAYVLNATVVPQVTLGYLSLWPDGGTQPVVSTLNSYDGAVTSNMAIVPTSNGSIDAYSTDSTNLILDLSSFFAP